MVKAFPALERIVTQATASLKQPGTPLSPGITALFSSEGAPTPTRRRKPSNRSTSPSPTGRIYLVTAQAPREELNGDAVERLRMLVDQTKEEVPGLNVGHHGRTGAGT